MKKINGTILQCFEWYLEPNQEFWNTLSNKAQELSKLGITAVWLPPAYKGVGGKDEVGYGVYDLYDLGEFNQKGSIKTKYGSKEEYLNCIMTLKQAGMEAYADIVLNHKMGADKIQTIPATKVDWGNHNLEIANQETVKVATKFTFPERKHKYSDFEWNWTHFKGIDYNNETGEKAIFKFKDKEWSQTVDEEFGNFDYLMGADLDFDNPEVVNQCIAWGKWYIEMTKIDGFRLDAVKHINASFYKKWLEEMRKYFNKELFSVGEYWSTDIKKLHRYLSEIDGATSLFDVPLHYNLEKASKDESADLSKIFEETLVKENPTKAVTFVDNHDTQPGQSLESFINTDFKQSAYSIILLREDGYPCVFYGDLYGIPHNNIEPVKNLEILLELRKQKAYGIQHDYFDNPNYIGWTREGDENHLRSGLAVVITNQSEGEKCMYVGEQHAGKTFIDALENCEDEVHIQEDGYGIFKVNEKSVSVWVEK